MRRIPVEMYSICLAVWVYWLLTLSPVTPWAHYLCTHADTYHIPRCMHGVHTMPCMRSTVDRNIPCLCSPLVTPPHPLSLFPSLSLSLSLLLSLSVSLSLSLFLPCVSSCTLSRSPPLFISSIWLSFPLSFFFSLLSLLLSISLSLFVWLSQSVRIPFSPPPPLSLSLLSVFLFRISLYTDHRFIVQISFHNAVTSLLSYYCRLSKNIFIFSLLSITSLIRNSCIDHRMQRGGSCCIQCVLFTNKRFKVYLYF